MKGNIIYIDNIVNIQNLFCLKRGRRQYKSKKSWKGKLIISWLGSRLHLLGMVGLVLAALTGQPMEASVGLIIFPAQVYELPVPMMSRKNRRKKRRDQSNTEGKVYLWMSAKRGVIHMYHTKEKVLARSVLFFVLWKFGGCVFAGWVLTLPFVRCFVDGISVGWPWLGQQPEVRFIRWAIGWLHWGCLMVLIGDVGVHWIAQSIFKKSDLSAFGLIVPMMTVKSCEVAIDEKTEGRNKQPGSLIKVVALDGGYHVQLKGEFNLTVRRNDQFWLRLVILFLRQLEGASKREGSRATRDSRRPLFTQQQMAAWFKVSQPEISRWEKWWLERDWANLLSLHSVEVLTRELRDKIVDVLALFPWWGQERVYEYLRAQGVEVTHTQIRQVVKESGWSRLRQTLKRFFVISSECICPRDEGLTRELIGQIKMLVSKLEAGERLTHEEYLEVGDLQTMCKEADLMPKPEAPAVPWAQKMKWILFASDLKIEEGGKVRCTYCGSTDVKIKSRKPRVKRYQDERGNWQTVEVYRYYCHNPQCSYGSFTHMPLGLLPHSAYPLQMRLMALQMYAWGQSTYRRTGQAMGVRAGRIYCWVSAFGESLLPVASLFGVVRSSGVVGVDEKWVQVPEKAPRGSGKFKQFKPRRWMYVYFAVDAYTYDLLHIAIYANNTAASTRTFLLALRAKGYKPRVIVTDLRREYGPAIGEVFPHASHHECIFHALQWMHRQFKDVYGSDYLKSNPQAVELKEKIDAIFQAKTRRTSENRYAQVMALRQQYVEQKSEVASIFDTLQRHWPTLVNGIESTIIPTTNNAVERIIGRFDQHYQNFCGFDSIQSARLFLAVFEKVYRFTPFTEDAQPQIRGKCPLELAGYDISQLPMAKMCRGWALDWPLDYVEEVVPNV
jgi:DNA-directed RNA polymerase subunit RPC12/RpoP